MGPLDRTSSVGLLMKAIGSDGSRLAAASLGASRLIALGRVNGSWEHSRENMTKWDGCGTLGRKVLEVV